MSACLVVSEQGHYGTPSPGGMPLCVWKVALVDVRLVMTLFADTGLLLLWHVSCGQSLA